MVNGRAHFEEETRRASVSEEPNGQRGCCSLANEVDATLILAQSDSVSIFYVETLSRAILFLYSMSKPYLFFLDYMIKTFILYVDNITIITALLTFTIGFFVGLATSHVCP